METRKRVFDEYSRELLEMMPKKVKMEKPKQEAVIETTSVCTEDSKVNNVELFIEMISNLPDLTISSKWSDVKDSLSSDPRFHSISVDIHEQEFYNYVYHRFHQNEQVGLDEFKDRSITYLRSLTPWKEISHYFEDEFEKLDKAKIYQDWLESMKTNVTKDFMDLLTQTHKESKFLQKNTPTMGKKFSDLKKHLSQDPRWSFIKSEQEKDEMITKFIWELNKK
jgi:hypothetical protein